MASYIQLLLAICLLPTVFGCSCIYPPEYSTSLESLCRDYGWSTDVYVGRVINASCNCIPPRNDSLYGPANVSCLSGDISDGYFSSEVVAGATCDADTSIEPYGLVSCDEILNKFIPIECPYEGQVFMDCTPLCPRTCSNMNLTSSPCPRVCVEGCGCPDGMVLNEEQGVCVMPSQCPDKTCPLDGQVTTLCTSSCPQDCLRAGNESCAQLCDGCACAPPMIADYITGKCVQPEQCTACPIDGQVYTECGSSCPITCDNFNESIICTLDCWQGCECPSGMVIDVENRRCVVPSQCNRGPPSIISRTSENGRCEQQYVCFFNTEASDFYICQYTLEITEVFKGANQAGQVITHNGPDLLTSCGNPNNILSVGTSYIVGIGGPCSAYGEWTPYSQYPMEHLQALSNGCSNSTSSSVTVTSSSVTVTYSSVTVTYSSVTVSSSSVTVTPSSSVTTGSSSMAMISTVRPTSTSRVDDDGSSANSITSNLMVLVGAVVLMLYF